MNKPLLIKVVIRTIILIIIAGQYLLSSDSQAQSDSIQITNNQKGWKPYVYHNRNISIDELSSIIHTDKEAIPPYRIAKTNKNFGNYFLGTGVITMIYGCLSGLESGEKSRIEAGILAGLIVGSPLILVSIPCLHASKKHARTSIKIFNKNIRNH